ncbi:MAG: penicillin-binding transpeptidase domain-containing protein [Candidatus Gottesmanbacteria bacterium]|nr:penicillin-binding transpeptidase domain-containing protein [Candidatus Gottesmanbacteria bacterium]
MKLGKAFSDSVSVTQKSATRMPRVHAQSWWLGAGRALIFATILFVAFFVLAWRMFDLTIIQGHEFRALADTNRTRELIIHAPRGLLLDRTGKPLLANIPQYRLVGNTTKTISKEEGDALATTGLPAGSFLEVDWRRQYVYPDSLSQVTGYTGELTDTELHDEYYQLREYQPGDKIGRAGAEAYFEDKLRGRDGKELVEIDATGKVLRVLGRQEAIPGEDITLSVDASLSEAVAHAFPVGEKGAIVVSKPSTGEVLSLYSAPTFSANRFALGMSTGEYTALLTNPDRPLFNRAIGGTYPPGSTFKIVLALGGMEEGYVKPDTIVEDNGTITIGQFTFPNWYFLQYGKTEGPVDIVKALQRSNDIFFYKVGEWLGITKIAKWARLVGLGKPLGIELSGEATGLVPDPTWKAAAFNTPADLAARSDEWYLGDTYHVAIGQGYLLTTPLQVNAWTNIIASGGKLCRPTIKKLSGEAGSRSAGQNCKDLGIKKETIKFIATGLEEACATGGTGWPLFNFGIKRDINGIATSSGILTGIPVACKTGTAEFGNPQNRTHAWFTTFAPVPESFAHGTGQAPSSDTKTLYGDPELSITVLVEGAGEGSNVAAPVAKKILEEWFGR